MVKRREWPGGAVELDATTAVSPNGVERRAEEAGMLDLEQQANQAQALASLDDDWHLLEGERTTFAIFFSPYVAPSSEGRVRQGDATPVRNSNPTIEREEERGRWGERRSKAEQTWVFRDHWPW